MTIQAQTSDGVIHEFPDGTPTEVINKAMKNYTLQKSGDAPVKDWADVPAAALKNAPESAGNLVKGIGNAIIHPIDTISNAADVGAGAIREGAKAVLPTSVFNAIDQTSDPATNERISGKAKEAGSALVDRYGSTEALKQTLAKDPVGALADAASIVSGGEALAGRVPTLVTKAAKPAAALGKKAATINKLKPDYPEVAPLVAKDYAAVHDTGTFNLKNLDEAKRATDKLITDNRVIIKDHQSVLDDMLNPSKATDDANKTLRLEAQKAFASDAHRAMDHATPEQIDAVQKLVGHTKQGEDLVIQLKKDVILNKKRQNIQGGVSKFTDTLNPFDTKGGRWGSKGLPGAVIAATHFANPLGLAAAAGQAGVVIGGRVVDALTNRRSLPKKLMDDFKKSKEPSRDPTLRDITQERWDVATADTEAARVAGIAAEAAKAKKIQEAAGINRVKEAYATKGFNANTFSEQMPKALRSPPPKTPAQLVAEAYALKKQKPSSFSEQMPKPIQDIGKANRAEAAKTAKEQKALHEKEAKALQKASKPLVEPKPQRPFDTSFNKALDAVHKKMQVSKALEAQRTKATAPIKEAKASVKADKASTKTETSSKMSGEIDPNLDGKGRKIHSPKRWAEKINKIQKLTAEAEDFANNSHDKHLRDILDDTLKAFDDSATGHGPDNHSNRVAMYEKALERANTPAQKDAIKALLKPLANVFSKE